MKEKELSAGDTTENEDSHLLRKTPRVKEKWTAEEEKALIEGFEKYGAQWTKLLVVYKNSFNSCRRVIDLKIKHNLINKKSSYYQTSKRNWMMVDEFDNPILDSLGEIIVISDKFPYNAAMRFATKRARCGEYSFIIRIRESESIWNRHSYEFNKINPGKKSLRKLIP